MGLASGRGAMRKSAYSLPKDTQNGSLRLFISLSLPRCRNTAKSRTKRGTKSLPLWGIFPAWNCLQDRKRRGGTYGEMKSKAALHSNERRVFRGVCTRTQRPIKSQNKSRFQSDKAADHLFCGGSCSGLAAFLFAQRKHRDEPCGVCDDRRHAPVLPLGNV